MKKKSNKKENSKANEDDVIEFEYELDNAQFAVYFQPECVSEKLQKRMRSDIKILSEKMFIDKSCVVYEGNNCQDVFLTLEGWDNLNTLLKETRFGSIADDDQIYMITSSFNNMALGYVYTEMRKMYPNAMKYVFIELSNDSQMKVTISEDVIRNSRRFTKKS